MKLGNWVIPTKWKILGGIVSFQLLLFALFVLELRTPPSPEEDDALPVKFQYATKNKGGIGGREEEENDLMKSMERMEARRKRKEELEQGGAKRIQEDHDRPADDLDVDIPGIGKDHERHNAVKAKDRRLVHEMKRREEYSKESESTGSGVGGEEEPREEQKPKHRARLAGVKGRQHEGELQPLEKFNKREREETGGSEDQKLGGTVTQEGKGDAHEEGRRERVSSGPSHLDDVDEMGQSAYEIKKSSEGDSDSDLGGNKPSLSSKRRGGGEVGPLRLRGTRFILNNPYLCYPYNKSISPAAKPVLLIIVSSRRNHFVLRDLMRNTFGSLWSYENWNIRVVFLVGKGSKHLTKNEVEQHKAFTHIRLTWEFYVYRDIILGPFVDSEKMYSPATPYQHITGIRWALRYCPQAKYVVKVNDDTMVDTLEILTRIIPQMEEKQASLYCSKREDSLVKGNDVEYCKEAYVADAKTLKKLYLMVARTPLYKDEHDDIYVTGRLRTAYEERGTDKLSIFHEEHLNGHEEDQCNFEKSHYPEDLKRMAFHKLGRGDSRINAGWCYWKNFLEDKRMLGGVQKRRFMISSVAV